MDHPYCEICGEQHATWKLEYAGVCDDCFADQCREALEETIGKRCCVVYRQPITNQPAICLAMYGEEHTHGEVKAAGAPVPDECTCDPEFKDMAFDIHCPIHGVKAVEGVMP